MSHERSVADPPHAALLVPGQTNCVLKVAVLSVGSTHTSCGMYSLPYPAEPFIPGLNRDLCLELLDVLDIEQLVRLRASSELSDRYVAATLYVRLKGVLGDAIVAHDAFVKMLEVNHAVLGGLAVLHVFFPHHVKPASVDIFAPKEEYWKVLAYLVEEEDFFPHPAPLVRTKEQIRHAAEHAPASVHAAHAADPLSATTPPSTVAALPHLVSAVMRLTKGNFHFDLYQSTNESAVYAVATQWNSALFLYMGPRSLDCAYPALSREGRALLHPSHLDHLRSLPREMNAHVRHWEYLGWEISADWRRWAPNGACPGVRSVGCPAAVRFFGDRFCVKGGVVPVRERVPADETPREERETAVWWRGGRTCTLACQPGRRMVYPGLRLTSRRLLEGL